MVSSLTVIITQCCSNEIPATFLLQDQRFQATLPVDVQNFGARARRTEADDDAHASAAEAGSWDA
jgi:hypothetical protein